MSAPKEGSQRPTTEIAEPLTDRELEILELVADGWTDRRIAEHLILSLDTVKWYNKRVYGKLYVKNRTEAVARAREVGLFGAVETPPPVKTPSISKHNLRAPTTPFIGRELEQNELAGLLANENIRLVSLLAVGGMGKSRLATEVARNHLANFSDGVYIVPLAQLMAADSIASAIATAVGVQLSDGDPVLALIGYLRDKSMLLVLDNFEHLLDGAEIVTALLEGAPRVKILVTSRERLNLRGETVFALGGMTLAETDVPKRILGSGAGQLFIQGVQLVRPNTEVSDDELITIQQICRQVAGMPLGIQLASSLADILSLEEIVAEINDSIDILATEMRDMPVRLRSIRAVFDSSWSRLSDVEKDVYMRLAVFRGGFTRDAAKAVAGAGLRTLRLLLNKSLLQLDLSTERYILHELLRQYAAEQLDASGELQKNHRAHADFFADFVARCESGIKGDWQLQALAEMDAEFDNVRAAWSWAAENRNPDVIAKLLEGVYWFCTIRARMPDGERLLDLARQKLGVKYEMNAHPVLRRLLLRFDYSGADYRADVERMLDVVRPSNNAQEEAFFLWLLGMNQFLTDDIEGAIDSLASAAEQFSQSADDFYLAEALHFIGSSERLLLHIDKSDDYSQQIRKLTRSSGNRFALARILGNNGIWRMLHLNDDQAIADLREALEIRTALGDQAGAAISLTGLSYNAFLRAEYAESKQFAEEGLRQALNGSNGYSKAIVLTVFICLGAIDEDYKRANELITQARSLSTNPNIALVYLIGAAMVACGLEEFNMVAAYLKQLNESMHLRYMLQLLFMGGAILAAYNAHEGNSEAAVELLALTHTHPQSPAVAIFKWPVIERLQATLLESLGDPRYSAAWERGKQMAIDDLLNKFGEFNG